VFITNYFRLIINSSFNTEYSAIGTFAGDPNRKIPLIGYEYSEMCNFLTVSLVADCFV